MAVPVNLVGRFLAAHRRSQGITVDGLAMKTRGRVRIATLEAWEQGQRLASHAMVGNVLSAANALNLAWSEQQRLLGAVVAERFLDAVINLPPNSSAADLVTIFGPLLPSHARYWLARVFQNVEMEVRVDGSPATLEVPAHHLVEIRDHLLTAARMLLAAVAAQPEQDDETWRAAAQAWQWLARSLVRPLPTGTGTTASPVLVARHDEQRRAAVAILTAAYDCACAQDRHSARRDVALALYQGKLDQLHTGAATLATYLATTSDDPLGADSVANLRWLAQLAGDDGLGAPTLELLATLLSDLHRDEAELAVILTVRTIWQCLSLMGDDRIPLGQTAERLWQMLTRPPLGNLPRASEVLYLLARAAASRAQHYGARP